MRFTKILPEENSYKYKKQFAWFPTTIKIKDDVGGRTNVTIWLEYYKATHHYCYGPGWTELYSRRELL